MTRLKVAGRQCKRQPAARESLNIVVRDSHRDRALAAVVARRESDPKWQSLFAAERIWRRYRDFRGPDKNIPRVPANLVENPTPRLMFSWRDVGV